MSSKNHLKCEFSHINLAKFKGGLCSLSGKHVDRSDRKFNSILCIIRAISDLADSERQPFIKHYFKDYAML